MSKIIFNCPLGHFEPGTVELDLSSRINTFVGINNIGKSQLVRRLIELALAGFNIGGREGTIDVFSKFESTLLDELATAMGYSGYKIREILQLSDGNEQKANSISLFSYDTSQTRVNLENYGEIKSVASDLLLRKLLHYESFQSPVFIAAERDFVTAQSWSPASTNAYQENGGNIQQAYDYLQGQSNRGHSILERILEQLNEILAPDFNYYQIWSKLTQSGTALNLKVGESEYRAIHELGSGIKTILQALLVLNAYQAIWKTTPSCIVIEEIENNLHPRAIRRLIDILVRETKAIDIRLIFVTHSPVVMEHLAVTHKASTHHVFQSQGKSHCLPVRSFKETCEALDTIGAKASDILQANFVIWVEGPTEQIVLPHFIRQLAPDLVLGTDYIIALYGGKLLLHFSADMPTVAGDHRIEVARLNRNYAFIMDNDSGVDGKNLSPGKRAIFAARNSGVEFPIWITKAREFKGTYPEKVFVGTYGKVENAAAFPKRKTTWGCMRIVEEAWPTKKGKSINKVELAREAVKHEFLPTEKEDLEALTKIIEAIRFAKRS